MSRILRATKGTGTPSADGAESGTAPLFHSVAAAIASPGGNPLPSGDRARMEAVLDTDLTAVRLHTGATAARAARDVRAWAFTVGQDVFFAAGQYAPGTERGSRLLAHELTHTVQQAQAPSSPSTAVDVGSPADPMEQEAASVARYVGRPDAPGPLPVHPRPRPTPTRMVQGAWYDFVVDAGEAAWEGAEWAGGKVAGGARAVWGAAEWAGEKVVDEARRVGGAALECAALAGRSMGGLLTLSPPSLAEVLDMPRPSDGSPVGTMDVVLAVARHPCVRVVPGYPLLAGGVEKLQEVSSFLRGAWDVVQNPDRVVAAIREALTPLMDGVPQRAGVLARDAITFSDPPEEHLAGIWRHLEPKLQYLGAHWWEILKDTAWDLLWPWPGVASDLDGIWTHIEGSASSIWDLEISAATDHLLAAWRLTNQMAGRLYGWFFLGSVLGGAVLGAFGGAGVGALPGAAAGAKFALAVGQGLLISTVAAESLTIAKAGFDVVHGPQTDEQNEEDYESISTSGIVLGITGVLYAAGALAARFARWAVSRVAGLVWQRPALRGRGTTSRGDVIEVRVATAARVRAILLRHRVTWLESLRRNFPVIDLVADGTITVTQRPGRAPLYQVNGGRIISVKSTAQVAGDAQTAIQGWVDDLSSFTSVRNCSVSNPSARVLMVATRAPLDAGTAAAVRSYAASRGVTLELFRNLPADHPAVVFPDAIPTIMAEAGVVAGDQLEPAPSLRTAQPAEAR